MSLSVPGPGTRNTQRRHSPLGSPHRTKTHKQLRCELRIQGMWSGQGKKMWPPLPEKEISNSLLLHPKFCLRDFDSVLVYRDGDFGCNHLQEDTQGHLRPHAAFAQDGVGKRPLPLLGRTAESRGQKHRHRV